MCRSAVIGSCEKSPDKGIRDKRRIERKRRRLEGTDGKGPARGNKRAAILDDLVSQGEEAWVQWPGLEREMDKFYRRRLSLANRTPSLIKTGPLSTAAGIWIPIDTEANIVSQGISFSDCSAAALDPDNSSAFIGDCPAIDLATILSSMRDDKINLGSYDLRWNHELLDLNFVVRLTVDLRDRHRAGLELRMMAGRNAAIDQHARIVWTQTGRARFLCPLTEKRVDTLFIRDGLLGSRFGLNLEYAPPRAKKGKLRPRDKAEIPDENFRNLPGPRSFAKELLRKREALLNMNLLARALEGHGPSLKKYLQKFGGWAPPAHKVPEIVGDQLARQFAEELEQRLRVQLKVPSAIVDSV